VKINIPEDHPRYKAMMTRHNLIKGCEKKIVAPAGLIAQGRGEAFDYLIGEKTCDFARKACEAAAAAFLLSEYPVISVNGNVAQIVPEELVELSKVSGAKLEINLFYREPGREAAILEVLKNAGASEVLGTEERLKLGETIPELSSDRRIVDPDGILKADLVFVPLEDGDRTEALVAMGKQVVTVDLNPISRTPRKADISIIDNITRAVPVICDYIRKMKDLSKDDLKKILDKYNNKEILKKSLIHISEYVKELSESLD
jgi:4-phosphopantoate--beta-alanine ligase